MAESIQIDSIREQVAAMRAAVAPNAEPHPLDRFSPESLVGYVRKMCDHADAALDLAQLFRDTCDSHIAVIEELEAAATNEDSAPGGQQ